MRTSCFSTTCLLQTSSKVVLCERDASAQPVVCKRVCYKKHHQPRHHHPQPCWDKQACLVRTSRFSTACTCKILLKKPVHKIFPTASTATPWYEDSDSLQDVCSCMLWGTSTSCSIYSAGLCGPFGGLGWLVPLGGLVGLVAWVGLHHSVGCFDWRRPDDCKHVYPYPT